MNTGTAQALLVLALLAAALLAGCAVEEFDAPERGVVLVDARDAATQQPIDSATVTLAGLPPRTGALPMRFDGIVVDDPSGDSIEVRVRPTVTSYFADTVTVLLDPPDTAHVNFQLLFSDDPGFLEVSSNQDPARVIIDEALSDSLTPTTIALTPGQYRVSAYRTGYRTTAEALRIVTIFPGETASEAFELTLLAPGNQEGELVPDFQLPSDFGNDYTIAQFRGYVTMLTFWFYACEPCREEFPIIERTAQEREEQGFRVLGVNVGFTSDEMSDLVAIREELGLSFPLLLAPQELTLSDFGVQSAPTNFIIDRDGSIVQRFGATDYADLNQRLDEVLGGEQ